MSHRLKRATKHDQRPPRVARGVELVVALTLSLSAPAFAADSVQINDLVIVAPIPDAQREATVKAVRAFYDFWNTGDEALLKQAIASTSRSHAASGPTARAEGPAFASRRFRAAPERDFAQAEPSQKTS